MQQGTRQKHEPSCYIFVANDVPVDIAKTTSATDIAKKLLGHGFWAFTEAAPHRARLGRGDKILVYLAGKGRRHFMAEAEVGDSVRAASESEKDVLQSLGLRFMPNTVGLTNIRNLDPVVHISEFIPTLEFIKDKKNYGLHLRLPVVRIPEDDFALITLGMATSAPPTD